MENVNLRCAMPKLGVASHVKDNNFIEMVNYVFHFNHHPLKSPLPIYFAYGFKVSTFPCKMPP